MSAWNSFFKDRKKNADEKSIKEKVSDLAHEKTVKKEESDSANPTVTCPKCKKVLDARRTMRNKYICYECNSYFRVTTEQRIQMVADRGTFEPMFDELQVSNPLDFPGYEEKLAIQREKTGLNEAVTVGKAKIYGEQIVLGICDARFMMSSMGHVMGERITAAIEKATEERLPVFMFCCSGGARMQEGIVSLMQMAKTSAAIKKHSDAGLLYVSVLTDPTTGGVTASFAMLGDVIMAEPEALIGFAGARVIEQTIGQKLPKGFQRAQFQLEHGAIDGIVERKNLKKTMYHIIASHKFNGKYTNFMNEKEKYQLNEILKERYQKTPLKTAWDKVQEVRNNDRPSALDYINHIFDFFVETHGDRHFADDGAIVGGIGFLDGQPVTVIGEQKGKNMQENLKRNFGMPKPEGYRKALRLMKQAEKFHRPVICFVNTPGAFCGIDAEERNQGEAIARNICEMSGLKVPVLCIVIGEGGSGGALAIAVGNEVWMMENSTYAILSPEGFASILWKDSTRAKEASEVMKITADDLIRLGVIEKIVPEYGGANKDCVEAISEFMKEEMKKFLAKFDDMTPEEIAEDRYNRFRKM